MFVQIHILAMHPPSPTAPIVDEKLLFRRQFVLSSEAEHALPHSANVLVAGRYHVSAHNDLELTHVQHEGKSLTLLGFMLDPDRPEATDEQILHRLIERFTQCEDLVLATESLGGRWVLVVHDGGQTVVLHDACAQRQVFFTASDYDGPFMCASEPAVMAEKLGLEMDPEAVDFIRSRKVDDFEIYWMPGDTTLYAEITALLPNHLLSLHDRKPSRYWPQARPPEVDQESALHQSIGMLGGIMESAAHRFPLSIPMTAGWDSRLVLALNQSRASTLHTFTICYPGDSAKSSDIVVPQRLLEQLGMHHHLVPYPEAVDAGFKGLVRRNNASCNAAYSADIQALHECYPQDRVCVTGDVAEIVKRYFHGRRTHPGTVTAEELAKLSRFGPHPFARKALSRWLEDAARQPLDVLDLFCWEQMAGRWQGKVRSEFDIVQESFAPLNCRALLELMLGVDHRLRRTPRFEFFRLMIQRLWPETLMEPINPPEGSLPRRVLSSLKRRVLAAWLIGSEALTHGLHSNEG